MGCFVRVVVLVATFSVPMIATAQSRGPAVPAAGAGVVTPPAAKPVAATLTASSPGRITRPAVAERMPGRAARAAAAGSDALMAGFETLADGSTRLFVELSQVVAYETRPGRATVMYVLKGAHVERRNNENPLVTVHFNTPVISARLVPHAGDVWFIVELRGDVQPTASMESTKLGGATLSIAFPRGDYLPAASPSEAPIAAAAP